MDEHPYLIDTTMHAEVNSHGDVLVKNSFNAIEWMFDSDSNVASPANSRVTKALCELILELQHSEE